MSTSDLKLNLMERLLHENDRSVLDRIRELFDRRDSEDVDFTDAELAELEVLRTKRISGETQGLSREESIRLLRDRLKK